MRQKAKNGFFTIFYPGRQAGYPLPSNDETPEIYISDSGEFVSICGPKVYGEQPSAVFYDPQHLRDLAHVLEEAADLFEENQAKKKGK